jgi:hypothetical protein
MVQVGPTMVHPHDPRALREAKPSALAGGLGGEERLEQLVLDLGRYAGAVVAHVGRS